MHRLRSGRVLSGIHLSRRFTIVGTVIWLSVCLMATGVHPELNVHLKGLWMTRADTRQVATC